MRNMKLLAVTIALGATIIPAGSSFAADSATDPVSQIRTSADPFKTLESMSDRDQNEVLRHLQEIPASDVDDLFRQANARSTNSMSASASSYYNDLAMGTLEKAACVVHVGIWGCNKAREDASIAADSAARNFRAETLHNGKGDAFRHCYWNARMVKSIGERNAIKVASNHEAISNGPAAEVKMDLANNATGRAIGRTVPSVSAAESRCSLMAATGRLSTLK